MHVLLYLILSHRNPHQVLRLARRLIADDPRARVAIHHDAAAPPLGATGDARILTVLDPVRVAWGDMSVVTALLHSLQWIAERGIPYRWLALLSGQDYPIGRLDDYLDRLDAGDADGYIEHRPAAALHATENDGRYFFDHRRLPEAVRPIVRRAWRANELFSGVRLTASRAGCFAGTRSGAPFDADLQCYRGSFWWTLSRPCVDYLRMFVTSRPDIVSAFARKLVPDESFVHSILASAQRFALCNDDQRHIVWPAGHDGSPKVLLAADYDAIVSSGKMLARKFDPAADGSILDRLDEARAILRLA